MLTLLRGENQMTGVASSSLTLLKLHQVFSFSSILLDEGLGSSFLQVSAGRTWRGLGSTLASVRHGVPVCTAPLASLTRKTTDTCSIQLCRVADS